MPRHLRAAVSSFSAMPEGDPSQWYGWQTEPARAPLVACFEHRSPPPDSWRREAFRGRVLEHAVCGSRAFAGNAWSDEDVDLFAGIYARMSGIERSSYRTPGHGLRDPTALREVAERARTTTTTT